MATDLTGLQVRNTYNSLLKIGDNSNLTGTSKRISDGLGNESPLFISTSQISIGVAPATGYDLTVNSGIRTGSIDVLGAATAQSLQFTGGSGTQATMSWNTDEETVDLIQNGATLQLGQEIHVHVRNNTGSTINDGTPVYVTGTLGASGRLTVAPMIADGSIEAKYFIGVTTEDIPNGEDGKVTTFGKIRGINTSAYSEGQTLYVSSTTAGFWQTTPPASPALDLEAAIVVSSKNNGTIFVRANQGQYLGMLHDVYLNSVSNNQFLVYNSTNSRWENQGIASIGAINLDTVTDNGNTTTNNITVGDINAGNVTLTGYLRGAANFVIDPAAHGDETGVVQILGDLRVDGTTTTINSTTVTINDKNIVLAEGSALPGDANGAGITIDGANASMTYNSTSDRFVFNKDIETNLVGNVTGDLTGNADTASTLETARNIAVDGAVTGNADFDGSGDITITTTVNHNHDDRYYTETESDTRFVNVDGDTMTGDLDFNDDVKAKFGTGDDLTVYHNATNSLIDNATGSILIRNLADDQDIVLVSDDGAGSITDYLRVDGSEGSVNLYHYGSKKLETTATGVSVTGAFSGNISTSSISGGTIDINGTTAINLQYNGTTQLRIDSLGVAYLGTVTFANDGISLTDNDSTTDSFFHANVNYDAGLYQVTSDARYGADYIQIDGNDTRGNTVFVISPKDSTTTNPDLYLGGDNAVTAPNTLTDWRNIKMNATSVQINNNEVATQSWVSSNIDLQDVTDNGATTTNDISTGRITIANNVSTGGFTSFDDYQILLYKNGTSVSESYGMGVESNNFMFNSDDHYRFYVDNAIKVTINSSGNISATSFTGDGSGLTSVDADTLDGYQLSGTSSVSDKIFNNKGLVHSTFTDFNTVMNAGANYLQGGTNSPTGTANHQWYGFMLGLGSDYNTTTGNANGYASQLYWGRQSSSSNNPYLWARDLEAGTWGSWRKMSAGNADNADTLNGVAGSSFLRSDQSDTASGDYTFIATDNNVGTAAIRIKSADTNNYGRLYFDATVGGAAGVINRTSPSFTLYFDEPSTTGDYEFRSSGRAYYYGSLTVGSTNDTEGKLVVRGDANSGMVSFFKNLDTGTTSYAEVIVRSVDSNNDLRIGTSKNYVDTQWQGGWVFAPRSLKLKSNNDVTIFAGGTDNSDIVASFTSTDHTLIGSVMVHNSGSDAWLRLSSNGSDDKWGFSPNWGGSPNTLTLYDYTRGDWIQKWYENGSVLFNASISVNGKATLSGSPAIDLTGSGTGTYNKTVIYNDQTYGFLLEATKATDSGTAAKKPITLTWRGGFNSNGGLNLTGDTKIVTTDTGLGIDTTTPGYKLDVQGSMLATSSVRMATSTDAGVTVGDYHHSSGSSSDTKLILAGKNLQSGSSYYGDYGQLLFRASANYTGAARQWLVTNALDAYKFSIIMGDSGQALPTIGAAGGVSNGTPILTITDAANVGIGTTSPAFKLDVNSTSGMAVRVATGGYNWLSLYSGFTGNASIGINDSGGSGELGIYQYNSSGGYVRTALSLKSSGNFGIGYTNPSEKLAVSGNIVIGSGYNGGIYADSNGTGNSDDSWGFQIQRTSGVDDYNVRMKFYPDAPSTRKIGFYNSRYSSWIMYADGNTDNNDVRIVVSNDLYVGGSSNLVGTLTNSSWQVTPREYGSSMVGNFGQWQAHGTYTNFNTVPAYWGWNYVQGNTNAPNSSSSQWYRGRFSLGDAYGLGTTGGDYWAEIAIPRSNYAGGDAGQMFIRTCEDGVEQSWYQVGRKIIGDFTATGDVVAYGSSDRRLKDNITPIPNALDKVNAIGGYEFDWNDNQETYEGHDVGVIAQEVEEVMPEVVTTREDGYKAVKYEKLVPLLIEAIKEQQKQIDELKARLDA